MHLLFQLADRRIHTCKQIKGARDDSCPSGLMAGSEPGAIVPVEVFVEENVIPPVGIFLELLGASVDRRFPFASRRKMFESRRPISFATSNRVM